MKYELVKTDTKTKAKAETEHGDNEHGNAYAAAVLLADHLVKPYTGV